MFRSQNVLAGNVLGGFLLMLLLAMAGTSAAAQDYVPGTEGQCPIVDSLETDRAFPSGSLASSNQYTVSVPSAILASDSTLIQTIAGNPVRFGDRLELIVRSQNDRTIGLFKQRSTERADRCGWMDVSNARNLGELTPLKVVDLPGRQFETGIDGTTRSVLDAQIVARASRDDTGALIPAPLFSAPDSRMDDTGQHFFALDIPSSFFSVASVLEVAADRSPNATATCLDVRTESCLLLLGGVKSTGREDILGWERGSDVELWPSTLSLYYGEGKANVPYYFSSCAAKGAIPNIDPGFCSSRATGAGSYTEVFDNNVPRFPIISVDASNEHPNALIYEVVAALGICKRGSQRSECRDPTKLLQSQGEQQVALDQLRNVDIMFVIDGTASMETFFKPAVEATIAFAERVARSQQISPRFSAVVYGDYLGPNGEPNSLSFTRVADFGGIADATNLSGLLATTDVQSVIQDIHRDQAEAPYAAIIRAIEPSSARWRRDAGIRLVIWIGDVGNRNVGQHSTRGGGLNETVGIEEVAAALTQASATGLTQIRLAAINVPSKEARFQENNRRDFTEDYEALRNALEGSDFDLKIVQSSATGDAREKVAIALDEILTTVRSGELAASGDIDCATNPSLCESNGTAQNEFLPMQIGLEVAKELGLIGLGAEATLQEDEIVAVEKVFVVQDVKDQAFDYWLALQQREMEDLLIAMSQVCTRMDFSDFGPSLLESYIKVLETATRRRVDRSMTPAELASTVLSVPKETFSRMLDVPFDFLLTELQGNDDEADLFQRYICTRPEALRFVVDGERVALSDFVWDRNRAILAEGKEPEPFQWEWSGEGGGNRYFFFPLDLLP